MAGIHVQGDCALWREGLASLLERHGVRTTPDARGARVVLRESCGAPVLTPPGPDEPALLLLSRTFDAGVARELARSRAPRTGYLLDAGTLDLPLLLRALRTVALGGTYLDAAIVARLRGTPATPLGELSAREREVLGLMAEGRTNRAIGELLVLSPKTVETHVRTVFSKLGLHDAPEVNRRVLAVRAFLAA